MEKIDGDLQDSSRVICFPDNTARMPYLAFFQLEYLQITAIVQQLFLITIHATMFSVAMLHGHK